jgi:large subunit ribosomal protein L30
MLNKVKHYISWIELDADLAKELLDKKARKSGYQKITPEDLKELGFNTVDDLAKALSDGTATLSKLKPLKPWFALSPPKHGFKRSTKKLYGQKGVLGSNKELGTIVRRMI